MNELKFNSQICTSIEQSQRLLDLGLKPETADCFHWEYAGERYIGNIYDEGLTKKDVPAWSLHRLIKLLPREIKQIDCYYNLTFEKDIIQYEDYDIDVLTFGDNPCLYDNIVDCIEWLISEGYFNKEYLKQ